MAGSTVKKNGGYAWLKASFQKLYDYASPQARLDKEVREFTDKMHSEGWKVVDPHIHTWNSDGAAEPKEVVEVAARRGIDIPIVTDHDSNEAWLRYRKACRESGMVPVKGREVTMYDERDVNIGHLLAYLPDETPVSKINSDLAPNQPFEQTLKRAKRMGAYTSFPHPISLDGVRAENVKKYAGLNLVDSVADDTLAKETGIRSVKGSDAHTKSTIGLRGIIIEDPENKIKSGNDLIKYLKAGGEVEAYELRGGGFIDATDTGSKISDIYYWPKGVKNFWYKFMTKRGFDMLVKDLNEYFVHVLPEKIKRNKTTYAGALNSVLGERTNIDNIEVAEGALVKGYDKLKEKFRK